MYSSVKQSLKLGFIFYIFFISCKGEREANTYYYNNGKVEVYRDSTYKADYGMKGYSIGSYIRNKKELILKSKYKECCIDSIYIKNSKSNLNENCFIFFRLMDGSIPPITLLILSNGSSADSFLITSSDTLEINKEKNYEQAKIIAPITPTVIASSMSIKLPKADTISIAYDYLYDPNRYFYYYNKKFKIKKKKGTYFLQ